MGVSTIFLSKRNNYINSPWLSAYFEDNYQIFWKVKSLIGTVADEYLSDLRIYDRALNENEIQKNMNDINF
jgi:hypothetical protein